MGTRDREHAMSITNWHQALCTKGFNACCDVSSKVQRVTKKEKTAAVSLYSSALINANQTLWEKMSYPAKVSSRLSLGIQSLTYLIQNPGHRHWKGPNLTRLGCNCQETIQWTADKRHGQRCDIAVAMRRATAPPLACMVSAHNGQHATQHVLSIHRQQHTRSPNGSPASGGTQLKSLIK